MRTEYKICVHNTQTNTIQIMYKSQYNKLCTQLLTNAFTYIRDTKLKNYCYLVYYEYKTDLGLRCVIENKIYSRPEYTTKSKELKEKYRMVKIKTISEVSTNEKA